jgi:hypothetical protein
MVMAQSAGTFAATGNMTAPRLNHTATLLPDGRVLIAGGYTACTLGSGCLFPDHAELYDPATRTFTATGSMNTAYARGAFLLPDGKVLIAGYDSGIPHKASVELYDSSTGNFTIAGKPATLTSVDSAGLLNDGRVLLIGGGAELYDPVSGTFSPVANWPDSGSGWVPAVLAGGKVLLVPDGTDARPDGSPSGFEIYDPATGTFNLTGALGFVDGSPPAPLLLNGAVLFTGLLSGFDGFGGRRAELYDPLTGTFAATQNMSTPRDFHSATLLPDGTVLVAGGVQSGCMPIGCLPPILASTEIYDPATSGFSRTGSLASARQHHTSTLLNNGQVLITGGTAFVFASPGTLINGMSSAELYTPAVLVPAPALFSTSGDGKGQGAIWHAQTGQIASADNPAAGGEALSMYTTSLSDGSVIPPQVTVGGRLAPVLYYGAAPGYPGYYQVNFVVPDGLRPGPAVPVRLTYIGRSTNAVTVGVQ